MSKRVRMHPVALGAFAMGAVALAVAGTLIFGANTLFARKFPVVMFFDENVSGLTVGAPVSYRGVRLGEVTGVQSLVGTPRIAVTANLERGPLLTPADAKDPSLERMRRTLEQAITQGLRAQLALQSLLTGQLYVSLVLRPDTPAALAGLDAETLEIPTIPTIIAQLEAGLQRVPLVDVPKNLHDTLEGTARLLQSPDVEKALATMGPLMADAQKLLKRLDGEVGPLLASVKATSDTARGTLEDVTRQLDRVVASLEPEAKQLVTSLTATSDTAREVLAGTGEEVKQLRGRADTLMSSLTETSDSARGAVAALVADLQKTLGQLTPQLTTLATQLEALTAKTQGTLADVDGVLTGDSPLGHELKQTLRELAATARSIQMLTEQLEENPESLLTGKGRAKGAR